MCLGLLPGVSHGYEMELRRRVLENKNNIMINIYFFLSAPFKKSLNLNSDATYKPIFYIIAKGRRFCGKTEKRNREFGDEIRSVAEAGEEFMGFRTRAQ